MSQTWIIKDTAPVDEASWPLSVDIAFTSHGGNYYTGIEIGSFPAGNFLRYTMEGGAIDIASFTDGSPFVWYDDAYKTLVFDTAPTGDLLTWLQKNADKSDPEYLTRKSELTSVANAIRAKGGTSAPLVYPDGFVTAINAITTVSPKLATITFSIASDSAINPHFVFATYISQDKRLINEGGTQSSMQERTSPFTIQTIQDSLLFMYHSGSASLSVSNLSGMQYSNTGCNVFLIPQAEICTCELFYPGD